MLEILRRIVQEVNAAHDLDEVLQIIISRIKSAMSVDVASIYLTDFERQQNVLMLSDGLTIPERGGVRLAMAEGLVGLVSQRAEPVNTGDAQTHPHFKLVPGSDEERFHSFLGVPVIHQRKNLGVLVVQRQQAMAFAEDEVSFLVTLAAQIASTIAHAEASQGDGSIKAIRHSPRERFVAGVAGSPGVAVGTVVVCYSQADLSSVPDREVEDIEEECTRFQAAVESVRGQLKDMGRRLGKMLQPEDKALFDAYVLLLSGDSLVNQTLEGIQQGQWAPAALRDVVERHARTFDEMDDPYLRERASDIRELGRRLLQALQNDTLSTQDYPRRTILVGEQLGATQLAEVPLKRLAGVVSVTGSRSTHVAILCRALGIPAVMGASDLRVNRIEKRECVVDGFQGRIYIDPSSVVRREYARLVREESALSKDLEALRDLPAQTPDGARLSLYVNTGLLADITPSVKSGAEGVGLYRTEFPFMARERFPGEAEQTEIYRKVLAAFTPRPVVLRTLDIGGDKALPYFPITEENPFLGWRGVRISLDHPEIFLTQLRAMLKGSLGLDNLNILFPMVSEPNELAECIARLRQAYEELREEGLDVRWPRVGAMIEVPAAVYQIDQIIEQVDYVSVGSNDLTQYLLAVDRNNSRVAKLYDALHPAVIRAIVQVVQAAKVGKVPVSVCGEMAGDPAAALLLMGMGVDGLSMANASLPRVKWVVRSFTRRRARGLLTRAMQMRDAQTIRELLNQALIDAGLGGLIRAGA